MTHSKNFPNYKLSNSSILCESFSKVSSSEWKTNYVYKENSEDYINSEKIPKISTWRRALMEDKAAIEELQTLNGDIANFLYRKQNIDELIEKSYFPVVQIDSKGNVVSFTAYDSFPNIPAVPSFYWSDWLSNCYRINGANAKNVLFVHYMVWQPEQEDKFLRLLLESSFTEFLFLKQIIIIKPPLANIPDFYTDYFIPVLPSGLEICDDNSVQSILICLRKSIIHPLPVRNAFKEEFDVIMSVIHNNTPEYLKTPYVLDSVSFIHQEEKKIIVCELEGNLAGVMILNLKVDLDSLNEGFELAPFHGLRKLNLSEEEIFETSEPFVQGQSSTKISDGPNNLFSSEFLFSQMNWELMLSKLRATESPLRLNGSSDSFSTDSEFSEFSFFRLSSGFDETKSETEQKLSNSLASHNRSEFPNKSVDLKVTVKTSISTAPYFYLPKCHGPLNAFVVDFFAVDISKVDEKLSSLDFLEAAFKTIPDREYCVLIVPTEYLYSPLLDLFVRVTPRPMSSYKQELYVCHKTSLSAVSFNVKNTEKDDLPALNNFLKGVDGYDVIYKDILSYCFDGTTNFKSFILTMDEKIIGVTLLDCGKNIEFFQSYFKIADCMEIDLHKSENQSVVKHLILNPIYNSQTRFFIRDIMRLSDLTCLYYVYNEHKSNNSIITVLGEFMPIKPKRKAGLNEALQDLAVTEKTDEEIPFSLFIMSPKLCGLPRIHLNVVIVVVGASRTALSFLKNLIFGPNSLYISYNNLICVTPHGLESERSVAELNDLMFPQRDSFTKKYPLVLSLETIVSFIYGIMTEINRTEKYIIVNNKATVRYDYLILTCGLQYLMPIPRAKEETKYFCKNKVKSKLAKFLPRSEGKTVMYLPKHPNNLFVINTTNDGKHALRTLQSLMNKIKNMNQIEKKIIVYGHDLKVFLTINTLLKLGIPGELIVFVEPFPSDSKSVTLFNDICVDKAVIESVKNCKVTYYPEYFLYDWSLSADDYITTITFHSKTKQLVIPCLAIFPFIQKLVSEVTYNACNDAGLVYDGRLVINNNFKTNDNYVYAAGPLTKYARRYYAADQDHRYFSSFEVGQKLADIIRNKTDITVESIPEEESDLVPEMTKPLVLYCQLPGDFNLFKLRKPGKELDLETAYNFYDYGEVLTTGDCQMKKGIGYFRLQLNLEGFVESITCYTKDKIDFVNLSSLYGMHEKLLNNLLLRYDLALIPDLFSYFRQPWAQALFHEDFYLLREINLKAFDQRLSKNEDCFIKTIIKELEENKWQPLSESIRQKLESEYLDSSIEREVMYNVMKFLACYKKDLVSYYTSDVVDC